MVGPRTARFERAGPWLSEAARTLRPVLSEGRPQLQWLDAPPPPAPALTFSPETSSFSPKVAAVSFPPSVRGNPEVVFPCVKQFSHFTKEFLLVRFLKPSHPQEGCLCRVTGPLFSR